MTPDHATRIVHRLPTALFAALLLAAPAVAETQAPDAPAGVSAQFTQIMTREQAAMSALAGPRISALAEGRRAARAEEAPAETLSARNADAAAPAAAAPARLDFAALDAMPKASGDAEFQCLAAAVYFESRGEPLAGQIAVAEVVLNRVDSPRYPDTICGVTMQGVGSGRACQFSYACDGRSDVMQSAVARARAEKIAAMLLDGRDRSVTDGATHFHATHVSPDWSRKYARTAAIGNHLFYRPAVRVAQN